jgi:MFS family permease
LCESVIKELPLKTPIYYGYWILAAAFIAQFVALGMYSYVLGPFMMPMSEELNWSRGDFALSRSIGQVIMAVTGIYIGAYVDRIGGKAIMLMGTLVLSTSLALHSLIESLWAWWLLNGVALTCGCAMVGNLVVNVTLSKWFVVNRGKAIAIAAMGVSLGGILITPFATWLIDSLGWREAWLWLAVLTASLLFPIAMVMRRAPEDYGLKPDGYSEAEIVAGAGEKADAEDLAPFTRSQAIRTLSFYALIIAFGFFTINIVVVLLYTLPYLADAGFSRAEAALAMVIASIPALISKPIWGYLIDRSPVKPLAAVSAVITGIALLLIIYAILQQHLYWIYAAYILLGLGWGGMIPMQEVIWTSFFGRRYIGAIRGAAMPFALILGALAPWLVGVYYDIYLQYHGALLVVAMLNIFSGLLIFLAPPPKKNHSAASPSD